MNKDPGQADIGRYTQWSASAISMPIRTPYDIEESVDVRASAPRAS